MNEQPIPGPDQTKSTRRIEETGTADDPHKEREPAPKPNDDGTLPPGPRPPPD